MVASQPCVFIVENDEALRDGLGMIIELAGMQYRLFDSLDCFFENYDSTPGCLLLDLDLNTDKGSEVRAEILKRNIRLPIIFLVGYGFPYDFVTYNPSAASVFIKPVQIERLIEKIKMLFKQ